MRAPSETAPPSGPEGAMAHVDGAGALWMVSLTFLWGLNAIAIKVLTLGMAPIMSAALRGVIALPHGISKKGRKPPGFRRRGIMPQRHAPNQ